MKMFDVETKRYVKKNHEVEAMIVTDKVQEFTIWVGPNRADCTNVVTCAETIPLKEFEEMFVRRLGYMEL